jgi:hypothetical protein
LPPTGGRIGGILGQEIKADRENRVRLSRLARRLVLATGVVSLLQIALIILVSSQVP